MPLGCKETTDMVCPAACLHGNGTWLKLVCKFGKGRSSDTAAPDDPLLRIQPHEAGGRGGPSHKRLATR